MIGNATLEASLNCAHLKVSFFTRHRRRLFLSYSLYMTSNGTCSMWRVLTLKNKFVAPDCTGLKTEWTSTMKTSTQFPVNSGTTVGITCSNSDAVKGGSSKVTCASEAVYTFFEEPRCSIPGTQANCAIMH